MVSFKKSYLTFAILSLLEEREHYGYELLGIIQTRSKTPVAQGILYPIIKNLEIRTLIKKTPRPGKMGRIRQYLSITPSGTAFLKVERKSMREFVAFLIPFLGEDPEEVV